MTLVRFASFGLIMVLSTILPAHGGAPVHGGKAAGMNTAFTAVADDPSAILHNPAGITQLDGTLIYACGTVIIPDSSYRSTSGELTDTQFQTFFAPHLFLTHHKASADIATGLGIYAPFGIGGRKWPYDGATRYIAIENAIGTVALNPTLAVQMKSSVSVAIGLDYMLAKNLADNALDQSGLGAGDARMKIDAEGSGWGYNLGLLWQPDHILSVGLAYRSGIHVNQTGTLKLKYIAPAMQALFGGANFQTTVHGRIDFPEMVDLGIAYRPTERWVIDIDAEWGGWSSFRRAELDLVNEVPAAGLTDISVPQNWHDVWAYKIGGDYRVNNRLSLRAGYAFLNTPVPEATLTAGHPDADQHNISLGFGWHQGLWTIDGFYNIGIFNKRQVNNTILSGTYESRIQYLGVSVGHSF